MLTICTETKLLGAEMHRVLGRKQYTIKFQVFEGEGGERSVQLKPGVWNRAAIIDALIRCVYSQSEMEALINNTLHSLTTVLLTGAWSELKELLSEFNNMQAWRKLVKSWADELLAQEYN